jgi:voltage-dependent calcium channel T type alpha-1I
LANIGALLLLLIYLYSILGVFMFAPLKKQNGINIHASFESFGTAFLTLIRISTGEAWNNLMYDSVR